MVCDKTDYLMLKHLTLTALWDNLHFLYMYDDSVARIVLAQLPHEVTSNVKVITDTH